METSESPKRGFKGFTATLLALWILGVAIPNYNHLVLDHSISPPTYHMETRPEAIALVIAGTFIPVLCIVFLGNHWRKTRISCWCLLVYLFVSSLLIG